MVVECRKCRIFAPSHVRAGARRLNFGMANMTYRNESQLKAIVEKLAQVDETECMCHMHFGNEPLPNQQHIKEIIALCRELLFPGFFGDGDLNTYNMEYSLGLKCERLLELLNNQIQAGLAFGHDCGCESQLQDVRHKAEVITDRFIASLPELRRVLHTDVEAIFVGDPAVERYAEVIYCYPCVKAITNYRIAHELLLAGVPILPRMITELAHSETGIDIHPGAKIGESFAIDHGTGVVIGATAVLGRNCKIYQGVTLGARSFSLDDNGQPIKGVPRHPILGNDVVVYSNATILGRVHIGDGAIIGGNIWVTTDVAPGERLIQAKANANNILRLKNNNDE